MIIYQLLIHGHPENLNKKIQFLDCADIVLSQIEFCNFKSAIPVDHDYMQSEYNIPISNISIECFTMHHQAWEMFDKTTCSYCMVIEDQTVPEVHFSLTKVHIENLPEDWDVFFPFDKSETGISGYEQPSVLGYYWGSFVYFLSKRGVKKLLNIPVIRQDVDEEILECSMQGLLNVYMNDTGQFHEEKSTTIAPYVQKQKAVKNAILNTNLWTHAEKQKAKKLLSILSGLAWKNDIDLTLDSGSLLGNVRHGEIMPWDDDIDLAIEKSQLDILLSCLHDENQLANTHINSEGISTDHIKVWMQDSEKIEGNNHGFPFVDIWIYSIICERINFDDGRVYSYADFYPLKDTVFEGSKFKIPSNSIGCLNNQYEDWDKQIRIFRWSHRVEKGTLLPLYTGITVDKKGRITDSNFVSGSLDNINLNIT